MTTDIALRHYGREQAADLRPVLLEVYAEIYEEAARSDPFASIDRFAEGLDAWSNRAGWTCTVGYDHGQAVGYAYGAPLAADTRWWGGLLTDVPQSAIAETGTRTYALSELMVRAPWRKTGVSRHLHDTLLQERDEERATLLVDQRHPKVRTLYETWGWKTLGDLRPRQKHAPLFHAMLINLPTP